MKTLIIDTSDNREILVGLEINGKEYVQRRKMERAQVVLPMIETILEKHKIDVSSISAIKVNTGPGSFTGLRVGAAVANALGFSLKVPVNGKMHFVKPTYK